MPFETYESYEKWEAEQRKKDEETVRRIMNRAHPGFRVTPRMVIKIIVVAIFVYLFLYAWPAKADSLTENQVAQLLKQQSPLPLRQNVSSFWAQNLLDAQVATGLDSLDLSIAAVLRAIGLEQSIAGLNWCNLTNCIIANAQSTVAIDPNAGGGLSPAALYFGEVAVVATPEPTLPQLLFVSVLVFWLGLVLQGALARRKNA